MQTSPLSAPFRMTQKKSMKKDIRTLPIPTYEKYTFRYVREVRNTTSAKNTPRYIIIILVEVFQTKNR